MSETIWRRDDHWVGSEIEDSLVMINVDTGFYVALNSTAYAVWNALDVPASASEIASKLVELFDVPPEECRAAVVRLLQKMQTLHVAQPVAA